MGWASPPCALGLPFPYGPKEGSTVNAKDTKEAATQRRAILADRLDRVRARMSSMGVDACLVRSTDRFLNEYVPVAESARVWLTGYTGSTGEALVTADRAWLAVDGRYWLQAESELDLDRWEVVKVPLGEALDDALAQVLSGLVGGAKRLRVGFEPDRMTSVTLARFEAAVPDAAFKPLFPSPVEAARGSERPAPREPGIRAVEEALLGRSVKEKLADVAALLEDAGAEALLVQRLDEIMWLANLRGSELPFQATFRCLALATPERLFLGLDPSRVPGSVRRVRQDILFVPEAELWTLVGKKAKRKRVALDPAHTTLQARTMLEKAGTEIVERDAPLAPLRAKKNEAELGAMKRAFAAADRVVSGAIDWLNGQVSAGHHVTEAGFVDEVTRRFLDAGAVGLSFRVIAAAGQHGAFIHYGDPDPARPLVPGELMLLDTGAYFEEGYATDLTRTFLLGGPKQVPTDEQRRIYTLVLEAAVAGMTAVIPESATGAQLDALVRAPLWAEGLDYAHGTGHGVGINVHEAPPRIAPNSATRLEPGHVFSIEPGYYHPDFGGVRIENLCTVEAGPPGFLKVVPMTFCPLDARLIDPARLSAKAKAFLKTFAAMAPKGRSSAAKPSKTATSKTKAPKAATSKVTVHGEG